jgi:hypothetical protein
VERHGTGCPLVHLEAKASYTFGYGNADISLCH